jgi:acyl-CoA reductase-like NAD-dependent aldehyde dehydrogenase
VKGYEHHINGQWQTSTANKRINCVNPANGETFATIARGNTQDVAIAVEAASDVLQTGWGSIAQQRVDALNSIADTLESKWALLVEAEVNGKRIKEVRGQFAGLHYWYRHFATEANKSESYEPYGVVAAITPWNSPLMIAAWRLAPALAAGNAVVLKPSEQASVSTLLFADLLSRTDVPNGLINVVTGFGAEVGSALVSHPAVRKVSFTGSEAGGMQFYI